MRICKFFQVMWIMSLFFFCSSLRRLVYLRFAAPHFIIAYPWVIFYGLDVIGVLFRMWPWTFQYVTFWIFLASYDSPFHRAGSQICGEFVDERAASVFIGTELSTRVCLLYYRAISSCVNFIKSRWRWSHYVFLNLGLNLLYTGAEYYRFSNLCCERLRNYIYWPIEQPLASLKVLRVPELVRHVCTGWCRIT
jgi:hypothetical protein